MKKRKPVLLKTERIRRRRATEMKNTKISILDILRVWQHILGDRYLVVKLHRFDQKERKIEEKELKHEALKDDVIVNDEPPPMESEAICRPISPALLEESSKEMVSDKQDTSEVSESNNNMWKHIIKKELKVVLLNIAPFLNMNKSHHHLINKENQDDEMLINRRTDIESVVSVNKEAIDRIEAWSNILLAKIHQENKHKSKLHDEGTKETARVHEIEKIEKPESETHESLKYDNTASPLPCLLQESEEEIIVKKGSPKSVSDVSSTIDFYLDWKPAFQDLPNCKENVTTEPQYYNDKPKSEISEENQRNEVTHRQSPSDSRILEELLKKPVMRENIRLSPPYNLNVLNNQKIKEKTPKKTIKEATNSRISEEKDTTQKNTPKSRVLSFGIVEDKKENNNSIEELNFKKPVCRKLILDINDGRNEKEQIQKIKSSKDTSDIKLNHNVENIKLNHNVENIKLNHNVEKSGRIKIKRHTKQTTTLPESTKDKKTIFLKKEQDIPQIRPESSPKSRVSDSHTSTSSKTSEQLRSHDLDYWSDTTEIIEDNNNNEENVKRKSRDSESSSSSQQSGPKRIKLKRSNGYTVKSRSVTESTKDTKTICSKKVENIPKIITKRSPKTRVIESHKLTSSETCEKLRLPHHNYCSDSTEIIGDNNNNEGSLKRKCEATTTPASTKQHSPKRIKLKRSTGRTVKSNYVTESCTSTSVSSTATRLLNPLSTSTETTVVIKDLGPKSIGFGRSVSKESRHGSETSTERTATALDSSESRTSISTPENLENSSVDRESTNSGTKCQVRFEIAASKSVDSKLSLNEKVKEENARSAKSRLGPPVISESKIIRSESKVEIKSKSCVKSRLGIVRSTTKPDTEKSPNDRQSNKVSPYADRENYTLKLCDTKKLTNYRIPKVSQDYTSRATSRPNESQNSESIVSETENSDDEDYINLHPDESFSEFDEELDDSESKTTSSNAANSFSMRDSVFERFMKTNQSEFCEQYESIQQGISLSLETEKPYDPPKSTISLQRDFGTPAMSRTQSDCDVPNFGPEIKKMKTEDSSALQDSVGPIIENKVVAEDKNGNIFVQPQYFNGFCYHFLRGGRCLRTTCTFEHDVSYLHTRVLSETNAVFVELLKLMARMKYYNFLKKLYRLKLLSSIPKSEIILILKTLYNCPDLLIDKVMLGCAIDAFIDQQGTLKEIVTDFLTFLTDDDTKWKLFETIKERTKAGDLWDTTKDLVLRINNLSTFVIKDIIIDCMRFRPENAMDINTTLLESLSPLLLATIRPDLITRFNQVVMRATQRHNASLTMLTQSNETPVFHTGTTNQDQININNCLQDNNIISTLSPQRTNTLNVLDGKKLHSVTDDNANVTTCSSFALQKIDEPSRPISVFRARFTKFYQSLDVLRDALNMGNYPIAIEILERAWNDQEDKTIYTLSCYRRLCQEIKLSAHHVNTIKRLTVSVGRNFEFRKTLADIAKCVLIRLADEGLYGFAYSVLEHWKELMDLNASLVLLMGEIYLANDLCLEGFFILKRYNIIHSNREKWKVPSDERDENFRAKLLSVMLISLSTTYPSYALFLLEFLAHEQSSNFQPIDLTQYGDNVVSSVLLTKETDLIVRAARLIFKYDISLLAITYRALIVTVISEDVLLAKQLYQNAMGRGIYSSAKFRPVTHIVIDPNWTYEEIYLAFEELITDVLINIGPGLDRIGPRQVAVYIIIEASPLHASSGSDKDFYDAWKTFRVSKNLIADVLESRFDPPLKLSLKTGKIQRLQSSQFLKYLKAGHLSVNTLNSRKL